MRPPGTAGDNSRLEGLFRRIQHVLQIGRTTAPPVDSGAVQTVQVRTIGAAVRDAVPVTYHYGFTAVLPVGSDVVVLSVSGDSSKGVVVGTAHQASRPAGLLEGQVAIYDVAGSRVLLDNAGGITLAPAGGTVTLDGSMVVSGDATIGGKSFLAHVHGGVQTGPGDTGAPV